MTKAAERAHPLACVVVIIVASLACWYGVIKIVAKICGV